MEAGVVKQKGRPKEYRLIGQSQNLHKLIQDTLNKFQDKWDYLIVFDKNSWNIIPNFKVVAKPIKNIGMLSNGGIDRNGVPRPKGDMKQKIEGIDPSVKIPKGVKVGDKIKSDNWPNFTIVKIVNKKEYLATFDRDTRLWRINL